MKKILILLCVVVVTASSCRWKHIKGSGHIITEDRHVTNAERIHLKGSYNVEITQGAETSVKVVGDDNILPYIVVQNEGGELVIRSKDNINYSTDSDIKVIITTNKLSSIKLSGSGDVNGMNKFTGSERLELGIAGSGNINLNVNTPEIRSDIAGSGSINIKGETASEDVHIAGSGDYNGDELKSENATVKIAGNGDVKVYADVKLDVHVAGSGNIFYKGNPTITQKVIGSGEIKKMD